ncbi:hypothetical protein BLM14_28200 (plasmid) [Phyllobacterium zundukense]|nr:hypothetical protein BLM14_24575 [Phyllobacterium zundukense]ATU95610.1 hypothetical protein BLM14_28200 [Phyllobacterium zundukense]
MFIRKMLWPEFGVLECMRAIAVCSIAISIAATRTVGLIDLQMAARRFGQWDCLASGQSRRPRA